IEQFRQWHNPASFFFICFLKVSISIVITAISYKYIEEPIAKYKKKFISGGVPIPNLKADKNTFEPAGIRTR
ncbi:MAG: hypothetical protein ACRDE5_15190, partial [Ginsengibacter sp.]